jgi:hypothetical protein
VALHRHALANGGLFRRISLGDEGSRSGCLFA